MYGVDVLSLLSFMLYVIAKYPYKTDSVVNLGWRFVDIHFPTFMTYIIGKFTLQVDPILFRINYKLDEKICFLSVSIFINK